MWARKKPATSLVVELTVAREKYANTSLRKGGKIHSKVVTETLRETAPFERNDCRNAYDRTRRREGKLKSRLTISNSIRDFTAWRAYCCEGTCKETETGGVNGWFRNLITVA